MARRFAATFLVLAAGAPPARAGAAASHGSCGSRAGAVCEDEALGLLQRNVAARTSQGEQQQREQVHVRQLPDAAQVWKQLQAAVLSEDLQSAIQQAGSSDAARSLQEQLQKLQVVFPSSGELKQQFASSWGLIRTAANTERLQQKLAKARADLPPGKEADAVQAKVQSMQAQVSALGLDDIKAQAVENWASLQDKGVPLPNLSDVTVQTQQVVEHAWEAAGSLTNQAQDAFVHAQGALGEMWGQANVGETYAHVQDAAKGAWQNEHVQDALGHAKGAVSGALGSEPVQQAVGQAQDTLKSAWDSTYGSFHGLLR